jgi:hypothetical protein
MSTCKGGVPSHKGRTTGCEQMAKGAAVKSSNNRSVFMMVAIFRFSSPYNNKLNGDYPVQIFD